MLLHVLWNLIVFIIALGILITVHEFGHFLAARLCKVKVERFSIGFGPVLWKWCDSKNTEYVISVILFGGYIRLLNTQKCVVQDKSICNAFNCKNVWQKIIIILTGPIFNLIFSILLYTLVYMIGMPEYKPIINSIIPNSVVAQSGILSGVEIKSVNNVHTHDWESVYLQFLNSIGKKQLVLMTAPVNSTCVSTHIIQLSKNWFDTYVNIKNPIIALGILPYNFNIIPIISDMECNSVAKSCGLKINDEILAVNDQLIHDWESFDTIIKNNIDNKIKISIKRKCKIFHFFIVPDTKYIANSNVIEGTIGVFPKIIVDKTKCYVIYQYGLYKAITYACDKTWKFIHLMINTLINLLSGNIKIINIGGPILIAQEAGEAAQSGLIFYLMFLAVISINLAIVNLLPFPTLDGGHLLYLILQKIHKKLISKKIQNFGRIVGFTLLIFIICFVFFNDISKLYQTKLNLI